MKTVPSKHRWLVILAPLVAMGAAAIVYAPVATHPFLSLDDPGYVFDNRAVTAGLTPHGVVWALGAAHRSNWHPLTWLSLMLDAELFGVDPGAFHRTNLAIHVANVALLYAVLLGWTGARWRSGLAAALLAVHPIHVESVAWVSERKDLLALFFWLLALVAWRRYAVGGSRLAYGATCIAFAAALASKPIVVTFPFVLLLLDVWPLGRSPWRRERWLEKLPLFALAAVGCAITLLVQRAAMGSTATFPWTARAANAVLAYGTYLRRALVPYDLAVHYPYADVVSIPELIAVGVLLGAITAGAISARASVPWCTVGWLWFGGTLVPMIGLVQVGSQAMADRYAYVPFLGLYLIAAWGLGAAVRRVPSVRPLAVLAVVGGLLALGLAARRQVAVWGNPRVLFEQALANGGPSAVAHFNLGLIFQQAGDPGRARNQYEVAIGLQPDHAAAHNNLGTVLHGQGRLREALAAYRTALRLEPDYPEAHRNVGRVLQEWGDTDGAASHYREALRLRPGDPEAAAGLASIPGRDASR